MGDVEVPGAKASTSGRRQEVERWTRRVRVAALMAATLWASWAGANLLYNMVKHHPQDIASGATAITVVMLLSHGEKVALAVHNLWRYMTRGEVIELLPETLRIGFAVGTVAFTWMAWRANPPPPTTEGGFAEVVFVPARFAAGTTPQPYNSGGLGKFLLVFDRAVGPDNWNIGTALEEFHMRPLRVLLHGLGGCANETPEGRVRLLVEGFADSHEFLRDSVAVPTTDEWNREAANRRAAGASRYLLDQAQGVRGIKVKTRYWTTFRSMIRARGYNDRPSGFGNSDQGILNRRAEVTLVRAGLCERQPLIEGGNTQRAAAL